MPIPDYQSLMLPLLQYIAERPQPVQNAIRDLAERLKLSADERQELLPGGTPIFSSRVQWAGTYLVQAGLLVRPRRGVLEITQRGRAVLAEGMPALDNNRLSRFAEFNAFRQRSRSEARPNNKAGAPAGIPENPPAETPTERIYSAVAEFGAALRAELLGRVRTAPAAFFERLIVDLMLAMGYGAGGGGKTLGRPNDEGIDGVITQDPLGLDTVYLQAKRYAADRVVGIQEIQAFIGALVGHGAAKGVFVTASHFSNKAKEFSRRANQQRVILIDGEELVRHLVNYGDGVRTARTVELKRIDEDYFESSTGRLS